MVGHYFKTGYRNIKRNKGYSAINILGLAVGICCCILIMLFVRSEWSYDKFHSKADRIYRLWQDEKYEDQHFINTVTPFPMGAALREHFPDIEATCRIYNFKPLVTLGSSTFTDNALMVDSNFFAMFDFPLVSGNRRDPFSQANSLLLTKETAKKYFGNTDPLGQSLSLKLGDDLVPFTVSGITANPPEASSIQYNMLISFKQVNTLFNARQQRSWFNVYGETYAMLRNRVDPLPLENKFPEMMKEVLGEDYTPGGFLVHLQPITSIHLDNSLPAGIQPISNPKYSYILASIGILILLVACINFITLSVGRSTTRAMEVGVRKVMGAVRQQLIRQFWGEAFLLTMVSFAIGLGLSFLFIGPFNQIASRHLSLQPDLTFGLFCVGLILLIAVIAGIYPALVLSGFQPVEVLKGKLSLKSHTGWLRKSLVIGQFVASIAMIICTIVISEQMSYFKNKDLGYSQDQVVIVQTNMSRQEGGPLAELYRTELLKHPEVNDAAVSIFSLAETPWATLGFTDENRKYREFQYNAIDANFNRAMKIRILAGRDFDPSNSADRNGSALVNEAFVKEFGIQDPIGKKLPGKFDQQIIGVVRDFNFESLHTPVAPLVLSIIPDSMIRRSENISFQNSPQPRISVRMKPGNIAKNLKILEDTWKSVAPNQDFSYSFLDDKIAAQYTAERRTSTIVKIASGLSIFIACLGLFGLATLTVIRRRKEIGIRKVLGASIGNILGLLSYDFFKLVIIAALIAGPLAWWFMHDWLKDFAYRVDINWWVFILATVITLFIALATVSFQAIRAAFANPVKALRTE